MKVGPRSRGGRRWPVPTTKQAQKLKQWIAERRELLSPAEAIEFIKNRIKTTPGHARSVLAEARASGAVDYFNDSGPAKDPRFDWAYCKDDLEGWLDRQSDLPKAEPPAGAQKTAKAPGKDRCCKWLVALRKNGPPQKTKEEYKTEAMARFHVGPDQFRTAWESAAHVAPNGNWGAPGRHKKSSGRE